MTKYCGHPRVYVDGHVCSQHATCIAQVALPKLVHNALLVNQLWFGLAFLKANFSTDKDGLDCSLELETFFQLSLNNPGPGCLKAD